MTRLEKCRVPSDMINNLNSSVASDMPVPMLTWTTTNEASCKKKPRGVVLDCFTNHLGLLQRLAPARITC